MEKLIKELKQSFVVEIVFIAIGTLLISMGILRSVTLFYVFGGLILLLGIYITYLSIKKNKLLTYVLENYKTNSTECLDIINKEIDTMKKAIAVDQRKADGHGKDAKDSARDVERKTKILNKLLAVQEEITKYI